MREDAAVVCPICHQRLKRTDGTSFTRHVTKCRIRQSHRRLRQRQKEGHPCQ